MTPALPIDTALPELLAALARTPRAVLQAPPGAGKTTRVPLALLDSGLVSGRILMLEPRRLAARAAAERMAAQLGETVGAQVGYRIRGESKASVETRIEVVTEGILTRILQSNPELPGIGAVIFDEFHERSLNADLGLALCLDVADALRPDLMLIAMSATLDAGPVATLMGAPVITSEGRAFPVDTRWLDRPLGPRPRIAEAMADLVQQSESQTRTKDPDRGGGILVFLPGESEIRRVQFLLAPHLPGDCVLRPLYGAMPFSDQRAAIAPVGTGRKIVLATSIAETSLTIPDIRVVVDAGLARRARFDPGSGMARLVTERVSIAEATQRRGRAGRVAEGICYRLWTRGEEGALVAFPPTEIETGDLAGLALELAAWGAQPEDLAFPTQPPAPAMAEARALLELLGALDGTGRITPHGKALIALPLHPRLSHMIATAGRDAAALAALLADRDPLRGVGSDVTARLNTLRDPSRAPKPARGAIDRIRAEAKRLERGAPPARGMSPGAMAALAYPDRIGRRRPGDAPRYLLSGGKGAMLKDDDPLSGTLWLVALDTDGDPREATIRLAAPITESDIRDLFADRIAWHDICTWSKRDRRVIARQQERLGAVALGDRAWRDAPTERIARAMLDGIRELGLNLTGAAHRLAQRVQLARAMGHDDLPDMSPDALLATLEDWLLPMLGKVASAQDWAAYDLLPALSAMLDYGATQTLNRVAPARFTTPLGREVAIDYTPDGPEIALRLQEMFGVTRHPLAAGQPIKLTLLSPAQRPIQVTRDLPGFWAGSYADVRKDMRASYPKHPWPEDPTQADPTLRAKPRGT
ncbi:ATP-dependent helicase HrpB [Arenibacterium halophilum]|uniref:ATP-dependent helicase HrpB n=1 Tax=Arenibacterium halophilum TaxID=2583821 RepID=A0ABY2XA22_9RHOB|nr:ATP-dependent helicase HrpB [Arenibacterium halophilum]TMV12865.1 ATP-dependent helicase HrpB [Arenibacterium halophilum]